VSKTQLLNGCILPDYQAKIDSCGTFASAKSAWLMFSNSNLHRCSRSGRPGKNSDQLFAVRQFANHRYFYRQTHLQTSSVIPWLFARYSSGIWSKSSIEVWINDDGLLWGLVVICPVLVGAGGVTDEVDDGFGIAKVATGFWLV